MFDEGRILPGVCDSVAVEMYLEFACCAAVPGGGHNKEYALHLLHMCHGNIHVSINSCCNLGDITEFISCRREY